MIRLKFPLDAPLIVCEVVICYRFKLRATMALDTASTTTVITPQIARDLGFDLQKPTPAMKVFTATTGLSAPKLKLDSIRLLDEVILALDVLAMPLPKELRVDGLLGLNFLKHFKVVLDFETGLLTLERLKIA